MQEVINQELVINLKSVWCSKNIAFSTKRKMLLMWIDEVVSVEEKV